MLSKKHHVLAIAIEAALQADVEVVTTDRHTVYFIADPNGYCLYSLCLVGGNFHYEKQCQLRVGYYFHKGFTPIDSKYFYVIPHPSDQREFTSFINFLKACFRREKTSKHGGVIDAITGKHIC